MHAAELHAARESGKISPMTSRIFSRWPVQCAAGVALVFVLSFAFGSWDTSASQAAPAQAAQSGGGDSCPAGFYGSPATGCSDVNECASANGGCHKLAMCTNTKGARECGNCPKDFQGNGYVGCFDVNECPNGDCTDRIPTDAATAEPPVVTTSGDVTVAAVSEQGAPATFTRQGAGPQGRRARILLHAALGLDVPDRQDRRQLLGVEHPRQARTGLADGHCHAACVLGPSPLTPKALPTSNSQSELARIGVCLGVGSWECLEVGSCHLTTSPNFPLFLTTISIASS